jgi:hypothetical protein
MRTNKRITNTKDWIDYVSKLHNNKYDYSKSVFIGAHKEITITCPIHGDFIQKANNHKYGRGCYRCSGRYKLHYSDFLERCNERVDMVKYKIVDGSFKNSEDKLEVICNIHGVFKITPHHFLNGKGCPVCKIDKIKDKLSSNTNEFIKKAKELHGNTYDYSLVEYKRSRYKVKIICHIHGLFEQTPNSHLSGQGCQKCGIKRSADNSSKFPVGWNITNWEKAAKRSKNFDSFKVYIIRCWNDNEEFYKIGRTFQKISRRFHSKISMPYNHEVITEIIFDNARDCFKNESYLKRINNQYKYIPEIFFNGRQECYKKLSEPFAFTNYID